jgi:hypothetical protein
VTVVFADLVDFTRQSGRSQPPEIVEVAAKVAFAMREKVRSLRWPERRRDERPDRDGHRAGGGRCDRHAQVRI